MSLVLNGTIFLMYGYLQIVIFVLVVVVQDLILYQIFYKRPILFLNFIPISYIWHWSNATFVSKNLVWAKDGNSLSFKEHLIHCYATQEYKESGIVINDLTHDEILMYVKSFWNNLNEKLKYSKKDEMKVKMFWDIYKKYGYKAKYNVKKMNNSWLNPRARPCLEWLKYMGDEFLYDI